MINVMSLDLIKRGDFSQVSFPIIGELQTEIDEYRRVGMWKKVKMLQSRCKRAVIATLLAQQGFRLFKGCGWKDCDKEVNLAYVSENGLVGKSNYWRKIKLTKFVGNIPPDILTKLPDGSAKKAVVFVKRQDPIIAVSGGHIDGKHYYIGLFQWE